MNLPSIDANELVSLLLDEQWHEQCEIITDYMPRFPGKDDRPSIVVRCNNHEEHPAYLRWSRGPKQGFFWDIYGGNFSSVELAILALSQAPYPRSVAPLTFKIPINTVDEKGQDTDG